MQTFAYARPTTLAEAFSILQAHGRDVRLLAGGTDLIIRLRDGTARPTIVVDVKRIPELRPAIREEAGRLTISATTVMSEIAANERVRRHFVALAEAAVYLATAPKSNRVYVAWTAAQAAARETPAAGVPLHIRNAPTQLMKDLGYGAGYEYAHAVPEGYTPQDYLPDEVADRVFYEPTAFGFEKEIAKRLEWWRSLRARSRAPAEPDDR